VPLPFYYFNTTPNIKNCKQAAHFAKRNTKFGGGGKRGRAKIPSPNPLPFCPPERQKFFSKKVRAKRIITALLYA